MMFRNFHHITRASPSSLSRAKVTFKSIPEGNKKMLFFLANYDVLARSNKLNASIKKVKHLKQNRPREIAKTSIFNQYSSCLETLFVETNDLCRHNQSFEGRKMLLNLKTLFGFSLVKQTRKTIKQYWFDILTSLFHCQFSSTSKTCENWTNQMSDGVFRFIVEN